MSTGLRVATNKEEAKNYKIVKIASSVKSERRESCHISTGKLVKTWGWRGGRGYIRRMVQHTFNISVTQLSPEGGN